jgi:hypothetical protein
MFYITTNKTKQNKMRVGLVSLFWFPPFFSCFFFVCVFCGDRVVWRCGAAEWRIVIQSVWWVNVTCEVYVHVWCVCIEAIHVHVCIWLCTYAYCVMFRIQKCMCMCLCICMFYLHSCLYICVCVAYVLYVNVWCMYVCVLCIHRQLKLKTGCLVANSFVSFTLNSCSCCCCYRCPGNGSWASITQRNRWRKMNQAAHVVTPLATCE